MRKMMRLLGAWIHWIFGQIMWLFFRVLGFAIMAIIMVLASMYVIDYSYQKSVSPCMSDYYHYKAFIERKLWKSGEQEDRLYLVRLELTRNEVMTPYRAWVTPDQYAVMTEEQFVLNVTETKGGGLIIADWGVTIEEL